MTETELNEHLRYFQKREEELIRYRRDLHRIPEVGLEEHKTADYICSLLKEHKIDFTRKETAVIALIRGDNEGPCLALRADIDGLPIDEETGLDFASQHRGMMHACGHDGHTAIALGAAIWLKKNSSLFNGTVKVLFQPAEETVGGAGIMVKDGALRNPSVERIFGLHLMPYMRPGQIEIKKGPLNGSSTELQISVRGKSGHGAYPESGIDAILMASHVLTGIQSLVSRRVSPLAQAVISFGVIQGGKANNIIAEEVTIKGTMRTTDNALRDSLLEQLRILVESTCSAHGGKGVLEFSYSYPALINDNEETERIATLGEIMLGKENVLEKELPSMGVEDFSYFLNETRGAFYHLGCGPDGGKGAALHSSCFDMDEKCLAYGAALQTALVLDALNNPDKGGSL